MTTESVAPLRRRLVSIITHLNLYDDEDLLPLPDQILATRIYISCLISSLGVLLFYTGLSDQTHLVTVSSPSQTTFEKLSIRYPLTLVCPCSRISIPYETFVTFEPEYHPVCSSEFVDERWIVSAFHRDTSNGYPLDYRLFASSHFQVLASLCHAASRSISDALKGFATSQMISTAVLSSAAFRIQLSTQIDQLTRATIADADRLNQLVSLMSDQNHLVSSLRSNFLTTSVPGSNVFDRYSVIYPNRSLQASINSGDSCFCETTSKCSFSAAVYNGSDPLVPGRPLQPPRTPSFIIPGMRVGCTPKDSLFQSTLECLFDHGCLETFVAYTEVSFRPPSLSTTVSHLSRFPPNATIETIFQDLMLESLGKVSNFDDYFRTCAPQSCVYSYSQRFSVGYMLATLIKLVGGLNVLFGTLSPILVRFLVRKIQRLFRPSTSHGVTVALERHRPSV